MFEQSKLYSRVKAFMAAIPGQVVSHQPVSELDIATRKLRAKLHLEETFELIEDGLGLQVTGEFDGHCVDLDADLMQFDEVRAYNAEQTLDACCDIAVVNAGTMISAGLQDEGPFKLVADNNDLKLERGTIREDGKLVKPKDHQPPDFHAEIARQLGLRAARDESQCEFEAWVKHFGMDASRHVLFNDDYADEQVSLMWSSWCAAKGFDE